MPTDKQLEEVLAEISKILKPILDRANKPSPGKVKTEKTRREKELLRRVEKWKRRAYGAGAKTKGKHRSDCDASDD